MKYFTIEELCRTNTGLKNIPTEEQKRKLEMLIVCVLDPAREELGMPITVSSGYRSYAVNKKVGGVSNSQHCKGEAADLVCKDNAKLFEILKKQNKFDQLIWEKGNSKQPAWVHVSYSVTENNRHQVLRIR